MGAIFRMAGRVLLVAAAVAVVTRIVTRFARPVLVSMYFSGTLDLKIYEPTGSSPVSRSSQFRGWVSWNPASAPLWISDEGGGPRRVRWAKYPVGHLSLWLDSVDYSGFLRNQALFIASGTAVPGTHFWLSTSFVPGTQFGERDVIAFSGSLKGPMFLLSPEMLPTSLAFLPYMTVHESELEGPLAGGSGTFDATP